MTRWERAVALRCAEIAKAIGAAEFVKNVGYSAGQAIEAEIRREFQLDSPVEGAERPSAAQEYTLTMSAHMRDFLIVALERWVTDKRNVGEARCLATALRNCKPNL